MSNDELSGGCQCGAVRYVAAGPPAMAAICHCTMYRRAHAAPAVAWAMHEEHQVFFSNEEPRQFGTCEDGQRGFCANCGTQVSFRAAYLPGMVDVSIGSLDDPEAITPTFHYWYSKHLSWAEFADQLPCHAGFPPLGDEEG